MITKTYYQFINIVLCDLMDKSDGKGLSIIGVTTGYFGFIKRIRAIYHTTTFLCNYFMGVFYVHTQCKILAIYEKYNSLSHCDGEIDLL